MIAINVHIQHIKKDVKNDKCKTNKNLFNDYMYWERGKLDTKVFHCKYRFRTMQMFDITPQDLDLYLVMDHRQMKTIDAYYNVRMGYWA
jgi:hypothetical protein